MVTFPRLRIFAGPNGSGKTTIKNSLQRASDWFGSYINPDEIEKTIRETNCLSLTPFGITTTTHAIQKYFLQSPFLQSLGMQNSAESIRCSGSELCFDGLAINSYHASVLADFLRRLCMEAARSFSFETVMSSADKVELMEEAQRLGYRTYLYFIATEAPEINIARVQNRVAEGGHDVPAEKIVARYHRTLQLIPRAIRASHRAYFFDTTGDETWYFAEVTNGVTIELKSHSTPTWFDAVWNQF
jgi:predicted ABC-type ATPase